MLFLMKYLLIPKKKKKKRDWKKLKVETCGVSLGKHIQNGFKFFFKFIKFEELLFRKGTMQFSFFCCNWISFDLESLINLVNFTISS